VQTDIQTKTPIPPIVRTIALLLAVSASWSAQRAVAQLSLSGRNGEKATLSALADRTAYQEGDSVRLALQLSIEEGWHVNSHKPTFDYLIPTTATIEALRGWDEPRITYPAGVLKVFAFEDQPLSVYDGEVVIDAEFEVALGTSGPTVPMDVSLRYQACDDRKCLPPVTTRTELHLSIGPGGEAVKEMPAQAATAPDVKEETPAPRRLLFFVLLGIAGGLLLNAMPCVLPVLSLKVLGLVKSSAHGRRGVTVGALATLAGIVFSFWALAAAAVVAKLAGATVGWGVQFQEPTFVVFLTLVVVLFCLNLWGLFEVTLPSRIAGWADASGGEGLAAHFMAGLFATLLATPCSAPFLGTAVGFALSQNAVTIVVIFTAVGLGMALPYLAIAIAPGSIRFLPKPGAWMNHFRVLMGFFLAAAAVWLLYVLSSQVSRERLAFVQLALLALAFFIWMRHQGGRAGPRWALAGIVGSCVVALTLAASAEAVAKTTGNPSETSHLIEWLRFDRTEAERLAADGTLVFVDVTADWCFTCKVNERLALETPEVAAVFDRHGVVPMKADWTNRDDAISDFLNDHGRYGIPFYLLYGPGAPPHLFGELINKETVVDAVEIAASRTESPAG